MGTNKKALVYNLYLNTAGGGERATIDLCLALEEQGYEIVLITDPSFEIGINNLCLVFGITPASQWKVVFAETEEDVFNYCTENKFDLFVNFTFCSSLKNPAKLGIYCVMFPQIVTKEEKARIGSYQIILCISEFSDIYIKKLWGTDLPSHILPPPISTSHISAKNIDFSLKEKLIITVGRFNVDGHCKKQFEAIKDFNRLKLYKVLDDEWKYTLIGNLNPGDENERYFDMCLKEAGPDVSIKLNLPFESLQDLYRRASVLWQFTGVDLKKGEIPQHCEHLGLVAMDGMCYGTIPMVYQRSGVAYLVNQGETGFVFDSVDELHDTMRWMNEIFGNNIHRNLFNKTKESSKEFGYNHYSKKIKSLIEEARSW